MFYITVNTCANKLVTPINIMLCVGIIIISVAIYLYT